MSLCSSLPLPPGFPKQKFHGVIQLVFCISYRPVYSKVQPPRCYYVKTHYGEQKCKPVPYEYLNCRWCIFQLLACKLSKGRDQCVYNHLSVEYLYILPDLYPTSFPGLLLLSPRGNEVDLYLGWVAQSMVSFNHCLSSIKTNTLSRY